MAPLRISFILRSAYDVVPSNTNLVTWGTKDDPSCPLCNVKQSVEQVLSCCKTTLSQGGYLWRHNHVFKVLIEDIEFNIAHIRGRRAETTIMFCSQTWNLSILANMTDFQDGHQIGPVKTYEQEKKYEYIHAIHHFNIEKIILNSFTIKKNVFIRICVAFWPMWPLFKMANNLGRVKTYELEKYVNINVYI